MALGFSLIAAALAGSIILNLRLLYYAKNYYMLLIRNSIDPLGTWYYPDPRRESPREGSRPLVLFYGDSRSVAWPPPEVDGVDFLNRGISGQTTAQVLMRFDLHAAPLSPSLALIQVGINDLKAIPLYPDRRDEIVRNCREGITELIDRFRALGAGVIVTTIFPHATIPLERRPFWSTAVTDAILEVNDSLKGLATDDVRLLDAYAVLEDRSRVRRGLAHDALHLNRRGYDALNRELARMIRDWVQANGVAGASGCAGSTASASRGLG